MMKSIYVVIKETILLLRRDRIFLPAIFGGIAIAIMANFASDWSIENFTKILFDVGAFGFQITGSLVAIFWGTKLINDAQRDGSIELYLAAPIPRSAWVIGRFIGLAVSLMILAVILLFFWQSTMWLNNFPFMDGPQFSVFGFMLLGWLVLAALSMFFASFCGQGVALFATISLWVTGLLNNLVYQNLGPESSPLAKGVVLVLARFWDLQQFNVVEFINTPSFWQTSEVVYRLAYGGGLIAILLTGAAIWFSKRDVIS
jgi:ABC-type transport system involved in multi-copper enzyme maturation permease subunit